MDTPVTLTSIRNHLLSSLPINKYKEIQNDIERVKIRRGELLYKVGEPIRHIYFPESCIISMVTVFEDGTSVESGLIGREGMTGMSIALSDGTANRESYVQITGTTLCIRTKKFCEALERGGPLQKAVMNYTSNFFEQVTQSGACSSHHSLNERLVRLLLMCSDRIEGNKMFITHEFIAQMLGTYRPNITNAAVGLKEQGLIDYQRGLITILDKKGLENQSCECYRIIKKCFRKYLSSLQRRPIKSGVDCVNPVAV